uniref:Uncharacterized protein n=1 Tax=Arundo donax TaxID=35708 RepID=A0A0A9B4P5_ARUDO
MHREIKQRRGKEKVGKDEKRRVHGGQEQLGDVAMHVMKGTGSMACGMVSLVVRCCT